MVVIIPAEDQEPLIKDQGWNILGGSEGYG